MKNKEWINNLEKKNHRQNCQKQKQHNHSGQDYNNVGFLQGPKYLTAVQISWSQCHQAPGDGSAEAVWDIPLTKSQRNSPCWLNLPRAAVSLQATLQPTCIPPLLLLSSMLGFCYWSHSSSCLQSGEVSSLCFYALWERVGRSQNLHWHLQMTTNVT